MILIRLLFLFFWRRIRIAVVVGGSDIFTILSISFYIECDAESMLFIQTEAVLFKAGLEVFSALALKLGGGEGLHYKGTHFGISEYLMLLH